MTFGRLRETTRKREPGDERAVTTRTWVLMLACLTGLVAPATASDLCGTTVLANLKLDQDLTCPGNGLIVGADGIRINLNGHTITGPGSGVGINVVNRTGVVIVGGTVKKFLAGIQLVNSTAIVVKDNQVTGNQDGIFLIGTSGSTIKENTAWQNSRVGIMLRPSAIRNSTQNRGRGEHADGQHQRHHPGGDTHRKRFQREHDLREQQCRDERERRSVRERDEGERFHRECRRHQVEPRCHRAPADRQQRSSRTRLR